MAFNFFKITIGSLLLHPLVKDTCKKVILMTLPDQIHTLVCRCSWHPPTGWGSCHWGRFPRVSRWSGAELRPGAPSTLTHTPGTRSSVETASTTSPGRNTTQQVMKFWGFAEVADLCASSSSEQNPLLWIRKKVEVTTKLKSASHVCESGVMSHSCRYDALFIPPVRSHHREHDSPGFC